MKKIVIVVALWSFSLYSTSVYIYNNLDRQVSVGANGTETSCVGIALGPVGLIGAVAGEVERDKRPAPNNKFVESIPAKTQKGICRAESTVPLRVWLDDSSLCFQGQSNDFYKTLAVPIGQVWNVSIQTAQPGQKLRDMINNTDFIQPQPTQATPPVQVQQQPVGSQLAADSDYAAYLQYPPINVSVLTGIKAGNNSPRNSALYGGYPKNIDSAYTLEGLTGMMWAAQNNNVDFINYLFNAGASIEPRPTQGTDFQKSSWRAHDYAVQAGAKEAFNAIAKKAGWGDNAWSAIHDLQNAVLNNNCSAALQIQSVNKFPTATTDLPQYRDQNGQTMTQFLAKCQKALDNNAAEKAIAAQKNKNKKTLTTKKTLND